MASRKEYMKEWRKANPNYYKSGTSKRHCKECNIEVGKGKSYCSECYTIRRRAKAREHYTYTPEKREYYRKWRAANKDRMEEYNKRKSTQRYCKECNIEVGKNKHYCPECLSIRYEEQKKRHNLEQTEYRKERYDNRDKDVYNAYHREYQKGKKFRAYMREYQRSNRERINEYVRDRYQNDSEYRDRLLYNGRKSYERQKQSWYTSRLERIEKLKVCLEENK